MPSVKALLFVLLGIFAALFCAAWVLELANRKKQWLPTSFQAAIGCVTNFFDTLGIGSFATTTTIYRLFRVVPDEKIPGTLNVGDTLPTVAQAFIYITIVQVDVRTLVLLIGATVAGGWLGAGVVTRLPKRRIQIGMGLALLAASALIIGKLLYGDPAASGAQGLEGSLLIVAMLGNFTFGALMMIGVGAYAPIMIMISLLGMNPKTAFPIMMGSCAFLMPIASLRFIRASKYDAPAAIGLTLGGVPAVVIAAFLVRELPLDYVRWLVVVVVLYTAISTLFAARNSGTIIRPSTLDDSRGG